MIQLKKVTGFLTSAAITAVLYLAVLYVLQEILQWHALINVTCAYGVSMAFYFASNRFIVFCGSAEREILRQIRRFSVMAVINYLVTVAAVYFVKKYHGNVYTGSIIAGILTTFIAYFIFDRIIFNNRKRGLEKLQKGVKSRGRGESDNACN